MQAYATNTKIAQNGEKKTSNVTCGQLGSIGQEESVVKQQQQKSTKDNVTWLSLLDAVNVVKQ
jgi:hypothetical protein